MKKISIEVGTLALGIGLLGACAVFLAEDRKVCRVF